MGTHSTAVVYHIGYLYLTIIIIHYQGSEFNAQKKR